MFNSLRNRILLISLLMLTLLMSGVGTWLYRSFYAAQVQGVKETLRIYSYSLLGSADRVMGQIQLPEYLPEGRFNTADSGLLAMLSDYRNQTLWTSHSADNMPLPQTLMVSAGEQRYSFAALNGEDFLLLRAGIRWGNKEQDQYTLTLAQTLQPLQQQLHEYRNTLVAVLLGFGCLLLIIQGLVLHWGLVPLKRVARQLNQIHQGQLDHISGRYPLELTPLTNNLNLLLKNEQAQRERYRNQLADLSHSLKTPLAVIRGLTEGEAGLTEADSQMLQEIRAQTDIMNERIRYQLQRATSQSSSLSIRQNRVVDVITPLCSAMKKVYAADALVIDQAIGDVIFFGDEQDLLEIAGNLIDNACKYGHGRVRVSTQQNADEWQLLVEDNGSGVAEDQRERILQRGVRLDSLLPGQGIGLALVSELVAQYQGRMQVRESTLGGACFCVSFPSLRADDPAL